jgi:hypothetical protein
MLASDITVRSEVNCMPQKTTGFRKSDVKTVFYDAQDVLRSAAVKEKFVDGTISVELCDAFSGQFVQQFQVLKF